MTGIGTINPLGNNIQEYFANLKAGVSGAAPITHFDAEKFKTRFACEVKGYNWEDFFDRKEVRKYDLFSQYAMIAADQAMISQTTAFSCMQSWTCRRKKKSARWLLCFMV